MLDISKDQLIARVATLPQDLQDAIAAPETLDTLEALAGVYQLDTVHIGLLHRLTVKLLAGAIAPREFVTLITEDLGIEQSTSMLIAQDINRDIFSKVKDSLKSITLDTAEVMAKSAIVSPYASSVATEVKNTRTQEQISPATEIEVVPVVGNGEEIQATTPQTTKEVVAEPKQEEIRDITPPMVSRIMTNQVVDSESAVTPDGKSQKTETKNINILESKLGGAFSIKKNDSYPQSAIASQAISSPKVASAEQLATPLIAVVVPASAVSPTPPPLTPMPDMSTSQAILASPAVAPIQVVSKETTSAPLIPPPVLPK